MTLEIPKKAQLLTTKEKLYVDDVFATTLYNGNGTTQTITNGVDLAGKGGLVWTKIRNSTGLNALWDTVRGTLHLLSSNFTDADKSESNSLGSFNSDGFTLAGQGSSSYLNSIGCQYVSWTFRKAPKFFDVVTYTGNGVVGRQIPHGLGIAPGMIIVKRIDASGFWAVWHRSTPLDFLVLNETSTKYADNGGIRVFNTGTPQSESSFVVGDSVYSNFNGAQYVAYLFAHDPSKDGIVQCGTYTGANNREVTLGWEPQWLLIKRTDSTDNWVLVDVARGMPVGAVNASLLVPNASSAEISVSTPAIAPLPTGFRLKNASTMTNTTGGVYVYVAIRRPNKPPTAATQVFTPLARSGTVTAATLTAGFPVDLMISRARSNTSNIAWLDRLRGKGSFLASDSDGPATTDNSTVTGFDNSTGVTVGTDSTRGVVNKSGWTYSHYFFKRAPGFFDIVPYTGTGIAQTVAHNLGAVPELMVVKKTSIEAQDWYVYYGDPTKYLIMNSISTPKNTIGAWNNTAPSAADFTLGVEPNADSARYVAYLFASLPGISKVGSYTGTGGSQTINCGFASGARFILIKRTDATGEWWVWDTARGIIAAAEYHGRFDFAVVDATADSIDPDPSGFIVVQNATTNINVNGGSYIFLAIA